jgi:hypothetical protein
MLDCATERQWIFEAIDDERDYQEGKWGTSFDDKNTANDWVTYINQYASEAAQLDFDDEIFAQKMVKVAALATAALEAQKRNGGLPPRHYDV